ELVKIDPKAIGVGLYQHDVNQSRLAETLDRVVESAVNYVGVNLNTASKSLLKYVAGINSRIAENIIKLREEKGRIKSRAELTKVKGLGEAAFTQAAGFLRIPEADTFFDSTAVHPESYSAAEKLLQRCQLNQTEVKSNGALLKKKIQSENMQLDVLAVECGVGLPTLEDIIASLEKPNRDPRDDMPKPNLRSDILKMEDLKQGMKLKGTVRNVVDFGAFVDIGLKTDGLVHKSQMSDKYVKNPMDVVAVGDVINVRVLSVDAKRGRIGLSMVV
ncbi:MAG: helix-hairpin-helix domain-containing protein, partial [bacterium]